MLRRRAERKGKRREFTNEVPDAPKLTTSESVSWSVFVELNARRGAGMGIENISTTDFWHHAALLRGIPQPLLSEVAYLVYALDDYWVAAEAERMKEENAKGTS